jgi:hypothetical protein
MTTYYVGKGGDNANNGTTWALRKLTLNGAEDIPVTSGDVVYVGPGVYREQLTLDVSGTSTIEYIGDVTGANTDGIGGEVVISGSDNDQTTTRNYGIWGISKNNRSFTNFCFEMHGSISITSDDSDDFVIKNCVFRGYDDYATGGAIFSGVGSGYTILVSSCAFIGVGAAVVFSSISSVDLTSPSGVNNCVFINTSTNTTRSSIKFTNVGGATVKGCTFFGALRGVETSASINSSITVIDSVFLGVGYAMIAGTSGDLTEDYNSIFDCEVPRTLVFTGSNSDEKPLYPKEPILSGGYKFPNNILFLSQLSTIKDVGVNSSSLPIDLFSLTRPVTDSKKSRGAVQFNNSPTRETTTTHGSSAASIKLTDAHRHQIFVPVSAESTTITVYCYRETNYAGTLPQMVIREPGQTARTTTDTGSSGAWNQLSDTFTPSGDTDYVIVELVSNNTATSGDYDVFFDTMGDL